MSSVDKAWLGFDVGGQSIKAVLLAHDARVLGEASIPSGLGTEFEALVAGVAALGVTLSTSARDGREIAETIGVGIAGVMGCDGILAGSPNLPRLVGRQVRAALREGLGRTVVVDNDANCAAVAEGWHGGAADGSRDFLLVTLGSGVGSGLVLGGSVHHGATGYGCELGHTIVAAGGRPCGCGNRGCLEAYVSETAARALVTEAGSFLAARVGALAGELRGGHAHALFTLSDRGDLEAAGVVAKMIAMLGAGIASAVNLLDVPMIVIGGGIAPAVLAREAALRDAMQPYLFARSVEKVAILGARRGPDAGAVGAARLAMLHDEAPAGFVDTLSGLS